MRNQLSVKTYAIPFIVFVIYCIITALIFHNRIPYLFTHYAMPDVDTDGGLWYKWFLYYIQVHKLPYDVIYLAGYPFGYDISLSPISNIIYSLQVFILTVFGYSWSNLIIVTNIFSLLTYPFAAIGAYFLGIYITKNKMIGFLVGSIYSFSFYHVFMGRGQMSINHIELIPFYILSLLYFIDRKNIFSLLLSTSLFSVMFMADAYYAFFSGIFSFIILLLYKDDHLKLKINTIIIYYFTLILILILLNFNFILSNLFLFNKAQAAATGRNSIPRNELTDILYYYSPIKENLFYNLLTPLNYFLYVVPLVIIATGSLLMSRSRIFITFFTCLCLAILLSAYVPGFYWINLLYFTYFGMFRGVGRMILPAYLFIGILVGMSVKTLWNVLPDKKIYQMGLIIILTILAIISGLPNDQTWVKMTDFSKLDQIYQPIKNNKKIHIIAAYPLSLNFDNTGFPQPYQLLGQTIDEKSFANGAALYNEPSIKYQNSIKNIQNPNTIGILSKHGVDTIIIYNKLLTNAANIRKQLSQDKRLIFVGRYTAGYDGGYVSANELSRDISVYSLKNVQPIGVLRQPLFSESTNGNKINFTQISPYMYLLHKVSKDSSVIFSYPYSDKWQMYPGDLSKKESIFLFTMGNNNVMLHKRYNGFGNLWKPTSNASDYTIIYRPSILVNLGNQFTLVALFILFISILILGLRQIKRNGN